MRREWSTIVVVLLVVAVVLSGVTGCQRPASTRPASAPETAAADTSPSVPPSNEPTTVTVITPDAGETPSAEPGGATPPVDLSPTEEPGGEVPGDVQPTEPVEEDTPSPPAATEAPPPDSGTTVWHTVTRGETLRSIAQQYGTTWQAIQRENNLVNPNQIYVGQRLKIPTDGSSGGSSGRCRYQHRVQRGEWIWQIARTYGVDPYDLMAVNGLRLPAANMLDPGKVLCIP